MIRHDEGHALLFELEHAVGKICCGLWTETCFYTKRAEHVRWHFGRGCLQPEAPTLAARHRDAQRGVLGSWELLRPGRGQVGAAEAMTKVTASSLLTAPAWSLGAHWLW